jgi:hypothetical protein
MKIRIIAAPGELEANGQEALDVVRRLAGMDIDTDPSWVEMEKAAAHSGPPGDQLPRKLDHKALQQVAERTRRKHVTRIQRVMWNRIQDVLRGG